MTTPAPTPGASTIDPVAADSLQNALAAEHAALWCYALAVAFLPASQDDQARSDAEAHRVLRGAVEQTLTQIGARPVSALPAYATPTPVTDGPSAAALVLVAETDAMAAWRSVMERTTDRGLRKAALDALTDGTLRCARWRVVVGSPPAIPVFPGRP
ncbi:ferritin-like domain-containing protein [Pseudonocardia sp. GCM10023141]|uniref:ferritin-like domain-containing protein n=1 Tax=Pseudonocardia sp. GCM10023141 TaxID=3252653 RepID=UPI00361554B5